MLKGVISIELNGLSEKNYNVSENEVFDFFESINYKLYSRSPKSLNLFFVHQECL